MEEECQKYAIMDTDNLISKTAYLSYRLTSIIMCTCVASTVCYAIGIFSHQEVNITKSQKLLLKMDLPFDTNKSPIYEFVIIIQYFYQVSAAFVFGVFAAFLLMIVLHVGCQIDIMCQILMKTTHRDQKKLKFFIKRHQEIILLADKIEKFFTYIALSQLISNTLITCCLGYLIVITLHLGNNIILIKYIMFYVAVCSEAFIYCFAGEYLSIKSKLIADTAYEFLWYNMNPSESRLLIPIILRAQRGFTFTFGKFATLSMESFTAMMKASGSYMSVLLAMT
ncbi:odorant receptor 13a-like [Apis dorsata]|uniref:odorant receptor 13a-like n=1 Tax=Apis dorsata TaxID=7462 RepID=UPI0012930DE6|nr:odorant receptor 13a-like [Apis dorsata]